MDFLSPRGEYPEGIFSQGTFHLRRCNQFSRSTQAQFSIRKDRNILKKVITLWVLRIFCRIFMLPVLTILPVLAELWYNVIGSFHPIRFRCHWGDCGVADSCDGEAFVAVGFEVSVAERVCVFSMLRFHLEGV